jgi:hypothetical protein
MGKHRTAPFIPCRSAGIKGPVERASRQVRESPSPKRTSRSAETRRSDRERTGASSAADISLTAGAYDRSGLGVTGPALGQARRGERREFPPTRRGSASSPLFRRSPGTRQGQGYGLTRKVDPCLVRCSCRLSDSPESAYRVCSLAGARALCGPTPPLFPEPSSNRTAAPVGRVRMGE